MNDNRCIRVLADPNQIKECRNEVGRLKEVFSITATILNLAGNSVRLKILFLLLRENQMCPCDLSDVLGMTVPAISQHLRKLKDGGMVQDKKVGQTIFYSIRPDNSGIVLPILKDLIKTGKNSLVK